MITSPTPLKIKLLQKERILEVDFDDGHQFRLSCFDLRVHSPSAEARYSDDKSNASAIPKDVNIIAIEPVGQYAVRLIFDDGHQTGIYSWAFLYELGLKITNVSAT